MSNHLLTALTSRTSLRRTEEKLAQVISSALDAIVTLDGNDCITLFNTAAERMFHCPAASALNAPITSFLPEGYHPELITQQGRSFSATEKTTTISLLGTRFDGQTFPIEASISRSEFDSQSFVTLILRDVTERQRAEHTLRENEERFRTLVEQASEAFFLHDLDGQLLDVNHRACETMGCSKEELLGMSIFDFIRVQDLEEIKTLWTTLEPRQVVTLNEECRRKDGSTFRVEIRLGCLDLGHRRLILALVRDVTEIHRSEEVSRKLAAIVESTNDAIISRTISGVITSWNPAAEKMFGYTASEIIGQPGHILFPLDKLTEESEILSLIVQGTRIEHFETVRVRKTGEAFDASVTISVIKDKAGNMVGASTIIRDVTESKKSEQLLSLLYACVSNLNDIVMVTQASQVEKSDPKIIFVNDALERVTGYKPAEVMGKSTSFLHGKKTSSAILGEIKKALKEYKPIRRQLIKYRKDGSEFVVDMDIVPIFNSARRCTHFASIERDVTQFKHAIEQTTEQAALLDQTQDAILVRDLDGQVLFWNKGAERMYGWTRDEALGRPVKNLIYSDTATFDHIQKLTLEKGEWSGEILHVNKARQELTVEARYSLLRDKNGNPKSVLSSNTDVTEKKKIEQQFMRAQRMESIGTLAGGIAHDLNNILTPILLSLDMLKSLSNNPEALSILDDVSISARRGADIVGQVLSFARGMEGQRVEVQPRYLFKDIEHIIKDTFPKNIQIDLSIPDETWTILGDPTQIHQIFLNLCLNARDAMPSGGSLAIHAQNCLLDEHYMAMNGMAQPGTYVVISVTDSGEGIPEENLDKIFEPFFTTKEIGKGTGFGLSTVMAIVKSHGGFINVYSERNRGTTFRTYLPAAENSQNLALKDQEPINLPNGNGETILIVDDEDSILQITCRTLKAHGYRTFTASNGAEAIAIYAKHPKKIAVVITDMMMPVMDGSLTIYALHKINPDLKIIAASGLTANNSARLCGPTVEHFLTKPYTASTLLNMLHLALHPNETVSSS